MAQPRSDVPAGLIVLALLCAGTLMGVGSGPAYGDVTAVKGSAFGFMTQNILLFGGAQPNRGPAPVATLPVGGSATPVTASAATGDARYGPGILFTSGPITVSTAGTLAAGSVMTSADITNVNTSGNEVLTASRLQSACSASPAGATGSTTFTAGKLQTSDGNPAVTGDETVVNVPANPAPNTAMTGVVNAVGDSFRYVFNEQIHNADGSITVNAAHQYLLGPTLTGDLILGQVVCGTTGTANPTTTTTIGTGTTTTTTGTATTTTPTTTTTIPTTSTTRAPATTTTTTTAGTLVRQVGEFCNPTQVAKTAAGEALSCVADASGSSRWVLATTTAAAQTVTEVSGGAYGYYVSIGLFGGPAATRGPAPEVKLPAGGSATPVTASAATGEAVFGPAQIFTSDQIDVSTEGTATGGTVKSSAKITNENKGGQEAVTAATVASTCSASGSGATGSVTLGGAKLETSNGDPNVDGDETFVTLPDTPAPNTTFEGKVESVGDTFKVVLNEQTVSGGSITVNAIHMYLLGPTALGDLFVGQVRCSLSASTTGGASGGGGGGAGGSGLPGTGTNSMPLAEAALALLLVGFAATGWARPMQMARRERSNVDATGGRTTSSAGTATSRSAGTGRDPASLTAVAVSLLLVGFAASRWGRPGQVVGRKRHTRARR